MKFGIDLFMFPLYLVVIGMVLVFLGNLWELSITLLLLLSIIVLHKIISDKEIRDVKQNRSKSIDLIIAKLDIFSSSIEQVKTDIGGHYQGFVEKATVMETSHQKLTERVIDIENRVTEVRKTLGAAVGSLEDRMKNNE